MNPLKKAAFDILNYNPRIRETADLLGSVFSETSAKINNQKQDKRIEYEGNTAEYQHLWLDYTLEGNTDAIILKDIYGKRALSIRRKASHSIKEIFIYDSEGNEKGSIKVKNPKKFIISYNGKK